MKTACFHFKYFSFNPYAYGTFQHLTCFIQLFINMWCRPHFFGSHSSFHTAKLIIGLCTAYPGTDVDTTRTRLQYFFCRWQIKGLHGSIFFGTLRAIASAIIPAKPADIVMAAICCKGFLRL